MARKVKGFAVGRDEKRQLTPGQSLPTLSVRNQDRGSVMTRAKRDIRMTNEEWDGFKRLLGPEWLRAKVRRELVKEKRLARWKECDQ